VSAFEIDRTEVTAAQFSECFETGGCERQPEQMSVTRQSYDESCNYFRDFDLPSDVESQRAAATIRQTAWHSGRRSGTVRGWESGCRRRWSGSTQRAAERRSTRGRGGPTRARAVSVGRDCLHTCVRGPVLRQKGPCRCARTPKATARRARIRTSG